MSQITSGMRATEWARNNVPASRYRVVLNGYAVSDRRYKEAQGELFEYRNPHTGNEQIMIPDGMDLFHFGEMSTFVVDGRAWYVAGWHGEQRYLILQPVWNGADFTPRRVFFLDVWR
jgi:hypothetical protein